MKKKTSAWVRIAVDYGALIAFIAALAIARTRESGQLAFEHATIVLMVASVTAVILGLVLERRLAPLPLMSAVFSIVFGGLTLIFHDKSFVKMKLTFFEGTLAAAMLIGTAMGKNPLKALLGDSIALPEPAWRTLTIRYSLFFAAAAVANEIVWRNVNDVTWAWFKGGVALAAVVFAVSQTPFMMKHAQDPATVGPAEPPDPGF